MLKSCLALSSISAYKEGMDKKQVIRKVRNLLKAKGIQLTKFGEVLGSKGGQQAKIDRANRFVHGYQKSISLDEIKKLAKFFDKPESYFFQSVDNLFTEKKNLYMSLSKVEKLSIHDVDKFLNNIKKEYPRIFRGIKIDELDDEIRRFVLKIFCCRD
jgi:transcriptional regulator with XRE-family HTH domain